MPHFSNTNNPIDFPMNKNGFPFPTANPAAVMSIKTVSARIRELADEMRSNLFAQSKEDGIGIVHIYNISVWNPTKGGLTVAYKKCSEFKSGRMVQVAVATCSIEDTFNKKVGVYNALTKFYDGETIQLPILNSFDERDLSFAVKAAFTALYETM